MVFPPPHQGSRGNVSTQAEAAHRQTLQLTDTALRKDPDTLASMISLAESLRLQEKYAEAEAIDRKSVV